MKAQGFGATDIAKTLGDATAASLLAARVHREDVQKCAGWCMIRARWRCRR
jgi:hypothetical protein